MFGDLIFKYICVCPGGGWFWSDQLAQLQQYMYRRLVSYLPGNQSVPANRDAKCLRRRAETK